jgi:hypothetical protein
MVTSAKILTDAFERMREIVRGIVDGLDTEQLAWRPGGEGNPIGWLIWHLTRVQDDHVAAAAGTGQVWFSGGWVQRFDLPLDPADTGYGHDGEQVPQVRIESPEVLVEYFDAVLDRTLDYVEGLSDDDLERVVDASWDPPVTLGVRLVSVVGDDMQHLGQAAYVRGLLP